MPRRWTIADAVARGYQLELGGTSAPPTSAAAVAPSAERRERGEGRIQLTACVARRRSGDPLCWDGPRDGACEAGRERSWELACIQGEICPASDADWEDEVEDNPVRDLVRGCFDGLFDCLPGEPGDAQTGVQP